MSVDVFEMFAKLSMDSSDFDKGLEKVSNTAKSVAKGISVAVGAGATAIGLLTKKAVDSYSDYEQNAGGIKKLYGDAYDSVMKNAVNAYKTSGMSANKYMETATQFSASLISSLKGNSEEASKQTEVAMRAISDNWNTFGGDLESITDAYKGFSKQNYTMLDNLKLGYGGTKEEMERLIDDANEYAKTIGKASDMSIDSFSDIVTAIELVQEKQGVAGTTAKEAQTTIQGSLNMTKMAWENLLVAFGNTEVEGYLDNVGEAVDTFVSSASVAFNNVLPVVEKAFQGIVQAIGAVIPIINKELPTMISTLLPSLLTSAAALVSGIVSALPALLSSIVETIPTIISTLMTQVDWSGIYTSMSEALSSVVTVFQELGTKVFEWFTRDGLTMMVQSIVNFASGMLTQISLSFPTVGIDMITNIVNGILGSIGTVLTALSSLVEQGLSLLALNAPKFMLTAIEFVGQLAVGISNNLPQFINSLVDLASKGIATLMQHLPDFLLKGVEIVTKIASGIIRNLPAIVSAILNGIIKLISTITSNLPQFMAKGGEIVAKLAIGIVNSIWNVAQAVTQIVTTIAEKIGGLPGMALQWGKDLIQSFVNGIKSMIGGVVNAVSGVAKKVANFLHFSEPDEGPLANFHTYAPDMMKLFAQGIRQNSDLLEDAFNDSLGFASDGIHTKIDVSELSDNDSKKNRKSTSGITINVYPSQGMDIDELVEELMIRLEKARKKEEEVFA